MEMRVVPSGVGVRHQGLANRAVAAHLVRLNAAEERIVALHHRQLVHTRGENHHVAHPLARRHKASSSSDTTGRNLSTDLNNFFKSIFGGL
jgi:hypothetical protein